MTSTELFMDSQDDFILRMEQEYRAALVANVTSALCSIMTKLENKYESQPHWDDITHMLRCPISQDYSADLVKTPVNNHYYMYDSGTVQLLTWVKSKGTDPLTRQPLHDDMLLQTDTDAQSVCTPHIDTYGSQTYSVNANCHVCSDSYIHVLCMYMYTRILLFVHLLTYISINAGMKDYTVPRTYLGVSHQCLLLL
jgi:hypothetical protein